jgi:hypothetical protein
MHLLREHMLHGDDPRAMGDVRKRQLHQYFAAHLPQLQHEKQLLAERQ